MGARNRVIILGLRVGVVLACLTLGTLAAVVYTSRPSTYTVSAYVRVEYLINTLDRQTIQLQTSELLNTLQASANTSAVLTNATASVPGESVADLRAALVVQPVPQTQLLEVTAHASSPDRAAALASAEAQAIVATETQNIATANAAREKPLRDRLAALQTQVTATQKRLAQLIQHDNALLPPLPPAQDPQVAATQAQLAVQQQSAADDNGQLANLLSLEAQQAPIVGVARPAFADEATVQPDRRKLLLGGVGGGLAIGILVAAALRPRRRGLPLGGRLPAALQDVALIAMTLPRTALPPGGDPRRAVGNPESLNELFLAVTIKSVERPLRLLLVAGAESHAGTSLVAAALAVHAAASGKRVLLMDANVERPSIQAIFGLPAQPGLVDLLTQASAAPPDPQAAIRATQLPSLWVLPAGQRSHMQKLLLESPAMDRLLDALLASPTDLIVVDAPPVIAEWGTVALAERADGIVLVADEQRGRTEALFDSVETLDMVHAGVVALVMTATAPRPPAPIRTVRTGAPTPDARPGMTSPVPRPAATRYTSADERGVRQV
ncbi:MAG TPA: hypothetical protein VF116_21390 [Ktedonobacterales bacterium]